MTQHSIEIPEATYQLLLKQANRLQLTPELIIEQLVAGDLALSPVESGIRSEQDDTSPTTADALAAVERLTTLFADIVIEDFEQQIHDPVIALENIEIEKLLP